ncbi:50S ribosomal protein L1 [Candidatus Bathyarchaeota archaeon]|nr:50S ribosomal protein L1 [Candidatus Bathyarchaeota archaeon]
MGLEGKGLPPSREAFIKALKLLREKTPKRNFKQSIELSLRLRDLDLKRPENRLNEAVELPHPVNKPVKVCVIASGDLALRAKRAGVDAVLDRGELEALSGDKKAAKRLVNSYDHFIAEASLMPLVGRVLGSMLGPRGKMPTPVPPTAPVEEVAGRHRRIVRIRVRDQPSVKCRIGTEDMPDEEIAENALAVVAAVEAKLPKGPKNVDNIRLKATMGPSVKVI